MFGGLQGVGPESGFLGIGLDQRNLLIATAGQAQISQRLLVDGKHGGGSTVFRSHIGDRGTVANSQTGYTLAVELEISTHHFLLTQEFGESEHDVGGGDAGLALAGELDADHVRGTHPGGAAEHDVLGFETTNTNTDDTKNI